MDEKKVDYRNKWEQENRARIIVIAKPEEKEAIRVAAEQAGQSLQRYILAAALKRVNDGN